MSCGGYIRVCIATCGQPGRTGPKHRLWLGAWIIRHQHSPLSYRAVRQQGNKASFPTPLGLLPCHCLGLHMMIYNICDSWIQRRLGIQSAFDFTNHLAITRLTFPLCIFESIPVVLLYVIQLAFVAFKHHFEDYRLLKLPSWRTLYVAHQMRCRTFRSTLLSIEHYSRIA